MNKKIWAMLSLAILAIVCMGSASAFDLGSMFGGDSSAGDGENITIDGVDFHIPEGFKEVEDQAMDNETNDTMGVSFTINGKTFAKTDDDVISVGVATYDGFEVDDEVASNVGGEKLTINGVDGYSYISKADSGLFDGFIYAKDGKLVIITTTDKALFDEVVIG